MNCAKLHRSPFLLFPVKVNKKMKNEIADKSCIYLYNTIQNTIAIKLKLVIKLK